MPETATSPATLYEEAMRALANVAADSRAWRELGKDGGRKISAASRALRQAKDRIDG